MNPLQQARWLRNQQDKSLCTIKDLIALEFPNPYVKSINDIETSINLSYSDSDAGETP